MRSFSAVVLGIALAGGACSPYVTRGSSLYQDGRYIEAAEVFERTEYRLHESSPRVQAEYGLYRGLTFLRLGDLASAREWLSFAYTVERKNPGTLSTDEVALLDRGWVDLEHATAQLPPQAPTGVIAASTSIAADANGNDPNVPETHADPNGQRFVAPGETRSLVPR